MPRRSPDPSPNVPPDASPRPPAVRVRRAAPGADAHVAAVRAALRDGRLPLAAFAARAGLGESTARCWAAGEPVEDTWEAHAWAAAVTTAVPGWAWHGAAVVPPLPAPPVSESPRRPDAADPARDHVLRRAETLMAPADLATFRAAVAAADAAAASVAARRARPRP